MIQQALQAYDMKQQYGVARVPFHTQNGIDSPVIKTPVTAFIGSVFNNGTPYQRFPTGWSVRLDTNSNYIITHNLNTFNYTFVVQPSENYDAPIVYKGGQISGGGNADPNTVTISFISVKLGTTDTTSFDFALILGTTSTVPLP